MSAWLSFFIGLFVGILSLMLLRIALYNLQKLWLKKGNKLKSEGEKLQAETNALILQLEQLKTELGGR